MQQENPLCRCVKHRLHIVQTRDGSAKPSPHIIRPEHIENLAKHDIIKL